MDYQALKAADAALGIADPAAAAAALNQQSSLRARDLPRRDVRSILYFGGAYARIYRRVYHTSPPDPSDTSASANLARSAYDAAVTVLMTLDSDSDVIQTADDAEWAGVQAIFNLLVYVEDVTPGEQAAAIALRDERIPDWPVLITAYDIAAARSL